MTMNSQLLNVLRAGLFGATLCMAGVAGAQASSDPEKIAAAQTLYNDAVTLMDGKDYAAACPKLEEAVRLVPEGIGARLTLAECKEQIGQLASAWSQYEVAQSMAERAGQKERAARAAAKVLSLVSQLSRLKIVVPPDVAKVPKLTVTRRGIGVGEAQWGTSVPVDTGTHEIVVTAPGYKTWSKQVLVEKNGENVTITVEKPAEDESPAANLQRKEAARLVVIQNLAAERPWQKPLGFAVMGTGVVALGVGGVLGGLAIGKNNEANDGLCDPNNFCKAAGLVLRKDAVKLGNGSTAVMIVGGILALGGVTLVATSPSKSKEKQPLPAGLAMQFEITPTGLRLRGTF
ncbi:MAG TPA: PEGA domain-containing protein [Polyangium sp.]|nr:PEGA domain-containing protein [Polyangium sp.]